MEFLNNRQLQILAERTWNMHGMLCESMNENGFSFCSNCSNHGRYCVVERDSMLAIKDSLQDIYNNLLYLQRVKSSQNRLRDEALARLEETRLLVIDKINQSPEKQRKLGVLQELITFLGDEKTAFPGKFKAETDGKIEQKKKNYGNGISRFVVSTTRFALEFGVIFATIYSAAKFSKSRKQCEFGDPTDSTMARNVEFSHSDSNIQLDVLCGRG